MGLDLWWLQVPITNFDCLEFIEDVKKGFRRLGWVSTKGCFLKPFPDIRLCHLFIFLIFNFFNWSIVDLQYCVSFRCTAKWFSYIYIYFQIIFHYRLFQNIKYSSLLLVYFVYNNLLFLCTFVCVCVFCCFIL